MRTLAPGKLDSLIQRNLPVYVLNTSVLPSGDKGTIVVNFYDGQRREYFKMPPTFIPIAVTDAIPSKKLADSRDFRQCLLKGILTLVEPQDAEDFLSSPEAVHEYETLMLSEQSALASGAPVVSGSPVRVAQIQPDNGGAGPVNEVGEASSVSPRVVGIIESLRSGEIEASAALTEIRRHREAMTTIEVAYLKESGIPEIQAGVDELFANKPVLKEKPQSAKAPAPAKKIKATVPANPVIKEDDEMSPEERAADEVARAKAMSQQALHGESKGAEMIDKLLKGKK
jgi:hypothetical protein